MRYPRQRALIRWACVIALTVLALVPTLIAPHYADACVYVASYLACMLCIGQLTPMGTLFGPILSVVCATSNFWEFSDDFFGDRDYSSTKGSNVGHGYMIADTSASGTPTYVTVDGSETGEVAVTFDSQNEIQNVCLYQQDNLQFDIDRIVEFKARVKMNGASVNAATSFAIGLTGDRNAAIDSIAQAALFRIIGDNNIVVETDDGTHDIDDVATGKTLSNSYTELTISFACGKHDVRFFVNGQPVATHQQFDMSAYSGSLQLFAQIQKTAAAATDGFVLDSWSVRGRRSLVAG